MSAHTDIWQCPQCGQALDISHLGFYVEVTCPGCQHSEFVHTLLANFRIESVVGIGGMSVVLRARDLVLNRRVAIKVLNDAYRNQPDRISRFENECAMMAKVRHENVVSVYSAGRARKQFYIAMELVDGQDLETKVSREGTLRPDEAIDYTIQIVHGLEAAHKAGLLHRDMKPGNVIITPEGQAKVLDFGLALGKADEDTEEIIWATPYYVPPETLERKDEDARTDIYALGMTLRYLLTGVERFKDSPTSVSGLLQAKLKLPPLASLMPGADESLCDLVDHMTAFEPNERPASYRDLLVELEVVKEALRNGREEQTPQNRSRQRKQLVTDILLTGLLGVAAAIVTANIATPQAVRQRIAVPQGEFSWGAHAQLQQAEQALSLRDFKKARELFGELISDSTEPVLAAWAALHVSLLAELQSHTEEAKNAFLLYCQYVAKRDDVSPATLALAEQLHSVERAASGNQRDFESVQHIHIKALCQLWAARYQMVSGQRASAAKAMESATALLRQSTQPYNVIADEVSTLALQWAPEEHMEYYGRAKEALGQHNMAEAKYQLQQILKTESASDKMKAEAQVLLEVCDVAKAAFELLERKFPNEYRRGCSPDEVANLARKLGGKQLHHELTALSYMLQGDYDNAFSRNPYHNSPDAAEHFAVMMRDWQVRLKK